MRKVIIGALASLMLFGCSSNADQQRNLELLAQNRASVLSSELPLEYGPLSIMRARAKGTTIEIMMVYNDDAPGAKPTQQIMKMSVDSYCSDPDVKNNLEVGVSYRIQMRNSRGQLMIDQYIDNSTCQ
ncbi:GspS/AspS pilotin family protein [Vibrio sp. YMD68]|uniref:GspS/AspS pilotin family protein n=1 Tax=Vibrio sp. YMD68 TaxID=3042300 RepID=UPI002499C7FF|nr:GspS/AspS pilotin family protein [Vibrio sp. YMD68]WGW01593.1 GspS/AspS pilotin family protein [Vibrio sp. YMD68]